MNVDQTGMNVGESVEPVDNYGEASVGVEVGIPRIPQGFHN